MQHTPAETPADIQLWEDLSRFLARISNCGKEVAFWRARAQAAQMDEFRIQLCERSVEYASGECSRATLKESLQQIQQLHTQLATLVSHVPFRSRVNLIHRSLIPSYQQMIILSNLVASILCRVRHAIAAQNDPIVPAGSMVDGESRRELRNRLREIAPSWDEEEWNCYDYH